MYFEEHPDERGTGRCMHCRSSFSDHYNGLCPNSSGRIDLDDGLQFLWNNDNSGEIYGGLLRADGSPILGTSGWWRTEDPDEAAKRARGSFPEAA